MRNEHLSQLAKLVGCVVISFAVVGYFTGLQAPMNPSLSGAGAHTAESPAEHASHLPEPSADGQVIPATHYANMPRAIHQRTEHWRSDLKDLKSTVDPLAEVTIAPGDKQLALEQREKNRAFNGAPPTVPHPIDQRSDQSCVVCHSQGARSDSLRIPRMSHQFLANCTQCHVESNPTHMPAELFRENTFVGLAAPQEGPRAFTGAPPIIPHSTWMRTDCMSCHGYAGLQGIRTTHPWRQNCQQCHAPSATMNQNLIADEPAFLPPPTVVVDDLPPTAQ